MAAPETHIVLAQAYLDKVKIFNEKDFILGTSFPDIRYLGVVDRAKTHFDNVKLDDLLGLNSFMAGVYFHSYVDLVRSAYIDSHNVYSLFPRLKFMTQSDKFFEDMNLCNPLKNRIEVVRYFDDYPQAEKDFTRNIGISEIDLKKWHLLLQGYLGSIPSIETVEQFAMQLQNGSDMVHYLSSNISQFSASNKAKDITLAFYQYFLSTLKDVS